MFTFLEVKASRAGEVIAGAVESAGELEIVVIAAKSSVFWRKIRVQSKFPYNFGGNLS